MLLEPATKLEVPGTTMAVEATWLIKPPAVTLRSPVAVMLPSRMAPLSLRVTLLAVVTETAPVKLLAAVDRLMLPAVAAKVVVPVTAIAPDWVILAATTERLPETLRACNDKSVVSLMDNSAKTSVGDAPPVGFKTTLPPKVFALVPKLIKEPVYALMVEVPLTDTAPV